MTSEELDKFVRWVVDDNEYKRLVKNRHFWLHAAGEDLEQEYMKPQQDLNYPMQLGITVLLLYLHCSFFITEWN